MNRHEELFRSFTTPVFRGSLLPTTAVCRINVAAGCRKDFRIPFVVPDGLIQQKRVPNRAGLGQWRSRLFSILQCSNFIPSPFFVSLMMDHLHYCNWVSSWSWWLALTSASSLFSLELGWSR
jgi:hypothetical protein